MIENVLEKLTSLFSENHANFRVLEHGAAGKSSRSVAEIRGTALGQGAKALVCHLKGNGAQRTGTCQNASEHTCGDPADRQSDP